MSIGAGTSALPSTDVDHQDRAATQARWAIARLVAALRISTVLQMIPSITSVIHDSPRPVLGALSWSISVLSLLGLAIWSVIQRRPPGPTWVMADATLQVFLTILGLWTVPVDLRLGSWVGYHGAYAISVLCSMGALQRRGLWATLVALIVAARLLYLWPVASTPRGAATVCGELLTLLAIAPLAWYGSRLLMRLASEADSARELAARYARADEERRARMAIHNGAAVLRLLVEHAQTSAKAGSPAPEVWFQAQTELNRMRAYLSGEPEPHEESEELADIAQSVSREFPDLPIHLVSELARGVRLGEASGDVASALRSVLLNVRQHAHASRVVIHAEELEAGPGWSITVHDNGVGFDPETTRFGVGLRDVTVNQLARHDVRTVIDSVPNLGTTVTITQTRPRS